MSNSASLEESFVDIRYKGRIGLMTDQTRATSISYMSSTTEGFKRRNIKNNYIIPQQ